VIYILPQVDAHTGKHIELASEFGLSLSTIKTIVIGHEEIERHTSQCVIQATEIIEMFTASGTIESLLSHSSSKYLCVMLP
jgi:hypothetical protein